MKTSTLLLPLFALAIGAATAADTSPASKQIDAILAKEWKANSLQPNAPASDETFLRRVYLDVIGRIPTYDEATSFLNSKEADKRAKLIDRLLASEGYVQHFFNYWADILRAQSTGIGGNLAAHTYLNYLKDSLRTNKPYDKLVRELVTTEGDCMDCGAIGYYMRDRGMNLDNLSNTTRIFLGTRLECAQCHNHPFDKWSQMDFYKMAAFTNTMVSTNYRSDAQTEVNKLISANKELDTETRDMMRKAITEVTTPLRSSTVFQSKSKLTLPHDYKYADAKPKQVVDASVMFGKQAELTKESNPVAVFGDWLTSSQNPRFTNVIANRLWKKVFGLALIEPLDELLDQSRPSNPELMAFLEKQMIAMKYDMKAYLRMLLNTQTYQRECATKEVSPGTIYHFQGPTFRRMSAEQAWDSLVALVNPLPDQPNWAVREREHKEVANSKDLAEILTTTDPKLLYEAASMVAVQMKEQNKEFDQLRKDLEVARAKDDKEKMKEIQRRLGESQRVLRETVSKCFYAAASKSGNEKLKKQLVKASNGGPMEMAMMNMMSTPSVPVSDMPLDAKEMQEIKADAELLGIKTDNAKSFKAYENYRKGLSQSWCRAAELTSPAPRGHFLREFGQSDRDTIENSNDEASVPQALTILNGSVTAQITNGWSELSTNMRKAKTADEKLDVIYLSLFARHPKPEEKAALLQMLDQAAGSNTIWDDILLAAISTEQFLFVQ